MVINDYGTVACQLEGEMAAPTVAEVRINVSLDSKQDVIHGAVLWDVQEKTGLSLPYPVVHYVLIVLEGCYWAARQGQLVQAGLD